MSRRPLITVNALLVQLRERGAIELPANALITPAARDWLRGARVEIRHTAAPASEAGHTGAEIYLVGDAAAPEVQALLPGLQRRHAALRFLPCNGHMAGFVGAIEQACSGLGAGAGRRAVAVVRDGAVVSCLANRHAAVRAAILAAPSQMFSLMHELGVNFLILERERLSLAQTRAAIERFLAAKSEIGPELRGALGATLYDGPGKVDADASASGPASTTRLATAVDAVVSANAAGGNSQACNGTCRS